MLCLPSSASQLVFNIRQLNKQISVAKFYMVAPRAVEVNVLEVKTGQTRKSPRIPLPSWFNDARSCSFVSSRYLICLDDTSLSLQLLVVGEAKSFVSVPLSNFGLKSEKKSLAVRLASVGNQEEVADPVFAVDLGGDGYLILRVQAKQVKLVKVVPNAKAVSIVPLAMANDGASEPQFGVFILIAKPEELKKRDDDRDQQQFKVAAFDLDSWQELRDLGGQFAIDSKSEVVVDQFCVLPFFKSNAPLQYKILITTEDHAVILASSHGKLSWVREESLSSIMSTEVIDLPLSELDASIEQAFGYSSNMVTQFMARISSQVYQLQTAASYYAKTIAEFMAPTTPIRRSFDEADFYPTKPDMSTLVRDYFGLHKIIVVLAKTGKLFGLDTLTGKIIWSFYDRELGRDLRGRRQPIFVQRTTAHYPFAPIATVVTRSGLILSFNPVTGEINERMRMPVGVKQAMLMSHVDRTFTKGVLLLNNDNHAVVYPSYAIDEFFNHKDNYFMLVGDDRSGALEGFSFASATKSAPVATQVWSLTIPLSEFEDQNRMDVVFKRPNEQVHSLGRVLGDRNVLYKYLNPNLVVVATEGAEPGEAPNTKVNPHFLQLYLIDAVTGAVVYTSAHKRCRGPVSALSRRSISLNAHLVVFAAVVASCSHRELGHLRVLQRKVASHGDQRDRVVRGRRTVEHHGLFVCGAAVRAAAGRAPPDLHLPHRHAGHGGHADREGHHQQALAHRAAVGRAARIAESLPGPAAADHAHAGAQGGRFDPVYPRVAHSVRGNRQLQQEFDANRSNIGRAGRPGVDVSGVRVRLGHLLHARDAFEDVRHFEGRLRPRADQRRVAHPAVAGLHQQVARGAEDAEERLEIAEHKFSCFTISMIIIDYYDIIYISGRLVTTRV